MLRTIRSIVQRAVGRLIQGMVGAAVPLVPTIHAGGTARAPVVTGGYIVAPAVELMGIPFLPEIGSDAPISKRSAVNQVGGTFGMNTARYPAGLVQSGNRETTDLRTPGPRKNGNPENSDPLDAPSYTRVDQATTS